MIVIHFAGQHLLIPMYTTIVRNNIETILPEMFFPKEHFDIYHHRMLDLLCLFSQNLFYTTRLVDIYMYYAVEYGFLILSIFGR